MDFRIIIYIILGILPSLTWLLYYLRKDVHPEPKKMILKIFLWGALITVPVFFVQIGLASLLSMVSINLWATTIIYWFLIIALSEELFKYLVIKIKILNSPSLDEPLDIMLYMVVAALGFAALENILYLIPYGDSLRMTFSQDMNRALAITLIRFVGATFLHTLCSAIIGYAVAISLCDTKNRFLEATTGVIAAVALHGLYNFSIMTLGGYMKLIVPVMILLALAFFVFYGFEKLKKMKGICKLN